MGEHEEPGAGLPPSAPVADRGEAPDAWLASRAAAGDRQALAGLYARHRVFVYWIVAKLLPAPEDAEDCAQEVWIKVREALPRYRERQRFRCWLSVVATNHARDMLRERDRLRKVLRAALEIHRFEQGRAGGDRSGDLTTSLFGAVAELDELPRRVVELRLEAPEITLEEIAARLDLPRHKVKYAWKTALSRLQQKLTEYSVVDGLLVILVTAALDLVLSLGGTHV